MSKYDLIGGGLTVEDVGGSFARFLKNAPKEMRKCMAGAVQATAFALAQRMKAKAPVGPDAPHIRDFVTSKSRGLYGRAGFIDATEQAGPNNPASIADVALYNEYRPNAQPFMKPAAEQESADFVKRMKVAMGLVERNLSGGGGLT